MDFQGKGYSLWFLKFAWLLKVLPKLHDYLKT